jgi:hypothetical protein
MSMKDCWIAQRTEDERPWKVAGFYPVVPEYFRLRQGVRVAGECNPNPVLDLVESAGDMRVDFIDNADRVIFASSRGRDLLLAEGVKEQDVEFIPVLVRDKKRRPLETPYFIVNPVVSVACMDMKQSQYSTYTKSGKVMFVERLQLLPAQIPEGLKLFRLDEDRKLILIDGDLVSAIEKAGLTGFHAVRQGEDLV